MLTFKERVSSITRGYGFHSLKFNKNYEWEILRFCNRLNLKVPGGFSKMFKFFINTYHPSSVLTYADARFGKGLVYTNNGFKNISQNKPNYFYVKILNEKID